MNDINLIEQKNSLQEIIKTWKDQIICLSPKGEGYSAYLVEPSNGNVVNYIRANCDQLRHLGTNYNSLLVKIKQKYYGYLKEAVLNSIKYEASRRAFRKQHEWIQNSYKELIEKKQFNAEEQVTEIQQLKQIIDEQKQEMAAIKQECRGQLAAIQAETLLKQKEVEIEQKNNEIARLNQQLQECDREIKDLKSELAQGLRELKLKYKWLIAQFIQDRAIKQQIAQQNKSLEACQNLFKKAQNKINLLQCKNKLLKQENIDLQGQVKMLRV